MKQLKTRMGTFEIDTYKVPKEDQCYGIETISRTNDTHWSVCTISQSVKVNDKVYSPVLYQSCMHPEQVTIYPLKVEQDGEKITFVTRYDKAEYNLKEKEIKAEFCMWYPKLKKKRCNPCQNCGRC